MEFNDNIDYAEVFGEDIDGDIADVADSEADDVSVGENEDAEGVTEADGDESADSSENDGESEGGPSGTQLPTDGEAAAKEQRGVQSVEDNARYAAARREAERQRDEAIKAERERHEKELSDVFSALGMTDPFTGKPVTNMAELAAYKRARAEGNKKAFMEKNGLTESEFEQFVSGLPEVDAARRAAAEAAAAKKQAEYEKTQAKLTEQIGIIGKLDSNIKSMDDLIRDESYDKILPYVKRGYALSDAYRIVNFDKLTGAASAAARQQVLNAQSGKQHLTQSESRGSGIESVPADVRQQYRELNPDMSDTEIARAWASYVKETRNK